MNKFKKITSDGLIEKLDKIANEFHLFDEVAPQLDLYPEFIKNHGDSITFFGGTFNPLHAGHVECIKLCPEKNITLILDRNPLKNLRHINFKKEITEILNKTKDINVSIYPGFWLLKEKNATADWITKVKRKEINLLMGDDSFLNFLNWKNPSLILNTIVKFYVVPRIHSREELEDQKLKIKNINHKVEIIFLKEHEFQSLSSTKIRKELLR